MVDDLEEWGEGPCPQDEVTIEGTDSLFTQLIDEVCILGEQELLHSLISLRLLSHVILPHIFCEYDGFSE